MRTLPLLALWLHVLGVVVWLGALMYQAHVLLPLARRGEVTLFADATRRQRPIAWTALSVTVLTGFYNVTRLGSLERVMESGAALLLAGKFILVLIVVALAASRDFTHVTRLALAIQTHSDPTPALRTITHLDRLTIVLAIVIVYLGLAISRS
jgi:uncharacterized membrane protein